MPGPASGPSSSSSFFAAAAAAFAKFSTTPGSYLSELHNDADYARGYAHYKSEKYTDALSAFRSYLETGPQDDPSRMRDAELRTADCFYALKSFAQAGEHYDMVLERGVKPMDYALFQRAMSAKLDEDPAGQVGFPVLAGIPCDGGGPQGSGLT